MGEITTISWTTHTFNHVRGCTKVSPGCFKCYADQLSKQNPAVLGIWGPGGTRVAAAEAAWKQPLKWDRVAEKAGERRRVFCASLGDVFEDWLGAVFDSQNRQGWVHEGGWLFGDPSRDLVDAGVRQLTMDDCRERLFKLIDATPHLDWLLLTKRPENILKMWPNVGYYRKNVWLLASVENQEYADIRIPELLKCRHLSPVLGLSMEPLLAPVDLTKVAWPGKGGHRVDVLRRGFWSDQYGFVNHFDMPGPLDWVIIGGESGHGARACDIAWIRDIRDECSAVGLPTYVKQLGANPLWTHVVPGCSVREFSETLGLRDSKGGDPDEWPEDLRIRQFPAINILNGVKS